MKLTYLISQVFFPWTFLNFLADCVYPWVCHSQKYSNDVMVMFVFVNYFSYLYLTCNSKVLLTRWTESLGTDKNALDVQKVRCLEHEVNLLNFSFYSSDYQVHKSQFLLSSKIYYAKVSQKVLNLFWYINVPILLLLFYYTGEG